MTEQNEQMNQDQSQQATAQDLEQAETVIPETAAQDASAPQEDAAESSLLDELRSQLDEQQQRLLRLQADYDNFRRRTRQEKEDFAKYASSEVVEKLLPVLDNFDRALAAGRSGNDYEALIKGVDMIYRQFKQVLEQVGLSEMNAVGQPFNPEYHNAVMKVEDEEHEEGIVLEELQKGYMFKDKVLRPAMVKVSG
mgnify:CR=1 FL=1|jgi:molecular chaperone GrpE